MLVLLKHDLGVGNAHNQGSSTGLYDPTPPPTPQMDKYLLFVHNYLYDLLVK